MSGLLYLRLGYRLCAPANWCRPQVLKPELDETVSSELVREVEAALREE